MLSWVGRLACGASALSGMLGSSGAAASSYGAAWHLPRAPAQEVGAPLGERLALSGQQGRARARRRRLERPKEAHFLSIFRSSESLLSGEVAQDENFPFLRGFVSLEARGISMKPVFFLMQIGPSSPRKPGQWAPGFWASRKPSSLALLATLEQKGTSAPCAPGPAAAAAPCATLRSLASPSARRDPASGLTSRPTRRRPLRRGPDSHPPGAQPGGRRDTPTLRASLSLSQASARKQT